jgi:hypothetical protein
VTSALAHSTQFVSELSQHGESPARNSSLKTKYHAAKSFPEDFGWQIQQFSVSTEIAALILKDLCDTDRANSFVRKILRASCLESLFYPDQQGVGLP